MNGYNSKLECQIFQCFWFSNVRISDPNCTGPVSDPRCVKAANSMQQFSRAKLGNVLQEISFLDFFYFYRVEVYCPDNDGNLRVVRIGNSVAYLGPSEGRTFHHPMAPSQQPGVNFLTAKICASKCQNFYGLFNAQFQER